MGELIGQSTPDDLHHYMEAVSRLRGELNELPSREGYLAMARTLRQAATDLGAAATAFRKLDEGTGYPPHIAQADAERAQDRVLATIRAHVGENDG